MQNPSVFLYGPGDARVEDHPVPVLKDEHDVIVRIAYVGVCGSDVSVPQPQFRHVTYTLSIPCAT